MGSRRSRNCRVAMLGLACVIANHGRSTAVRAEDPILLTLPGISWALKIEAPGFVVVAKELDPDGDGIKLKAEDTGNQITISAFIEKAVTKGGAAACRDTHWGQTRKGPLDLEDARLFETGPLAVVEFNIPKVATAELNQKHVHAYLAQDGYWMGVEITRNFHDPKLDPILLSILEHITIDTAYIPTIQEQFGHARFYYLKRDYRKAAESYAEILERTGPGSSLNRDSWRVLVNQLGMSYGRTVSPRRRGTCFYGPSRTIPSIRCSITSSPARMPRWATRTAPWSSCGSPIGTKPTCGPAKRSPPPKRSLI